LEALFDYSIIDGTAGTVPILYVMEAEKPTPESQSTTPDADKKSEPRPAAKEVNVKWLTKDGKRPTLIDIVVAMGAVTGDPPRPDLKNVVELAGKETMDAKRLCVVRMIGGAAGDAAQPVTGMIVRAFGGANLGVSFGLGALGKFSLGDNETLTKLVDTVVENVPRRATEMAIANALYGPGAVSGSLGDTVMIAEWLAGCQ
jgi:hypothetical protein